MPDLTSSSAVTGVVGLILGGGGITALAAWRDSRTKAKQVDSQERRLDTNQPVDLSAAAIKGTEGAVLIMQSINDRLVAENERLHVEKDAEIAAKDAVIALRDKRIETLESNLTAIHGQLSAAYAALDNAQRGYDALKIELDQLKS